VELALIHTMERTDQFDARNRFEHQVVLKAGRCQPLTISLCHEIKYLSPGSTFSCGI
jgi:hypothetical protein